MVRGGDAVGSRRAGLARWPLHADCGEAPLSRQAVRKRAPGHTLTRHTRRRTRTDTPGGIKVIYVRGRVPAGAVYRWHTASLACPAVHSPLLKNVKYGSAVLVRRQPFIHQPGRAWVSGLWRKGEVDLGVASRRAAHVEAVVARVGTVDRRPHPPRTSKTRPPRQRRAARRTHLGVV